MGKIQIITTPNGEELAILPLKELEKLLLEAQETVDIDEVVATMKRIEAGTEPTFPAEVVEKITLGENPIKICRKWRGLTQASLAEKVGTSSVYLSQIETGKRTGSADLLKRIATALNVPLDMLVD